ncbi:MAG TPA: choice-of-anchor P family protein [Acidimicrobiales bacterium]
MKFVRSGGKVTNMRGKYRHVARLAIMMVIALVSVGAPFDPAGAHDDGVSGNSGLGLLGDIFEIEGDTPDNPEIPGDDWDTPPEGAGWQTINFTDGEDQDDDTAFTQGSKWQEPGGDDPNAGWTCGEGVGFDKGDIVDGTLAFKTIGGKQYVAANYNRASPNGDVHLDYELNQTNTPNDGCTDLPDRTNGDIVIAFDTTNGGASLNLSLLEWQGDANTGTFADLGAGDRHVTWDGAVSGGGKNKAGTFGEILLNLTDTLGEIACGEFSTVHMASRASTSPTAALHDYTLPRVADIGECPDSQLVKDVRNVTDNGTFDGDGEATADPGDTVEYQLVYTNDGPVEATGVTVTEEVPTDTTFVANSCTTTDGTCTDPADPSEGNPITWDLGTQPSGATATMTFRVTVDDTFDSNTFEITNIAQVESDQEDPKDSNEATVTGEAPAEFTVTKSPSKGDVSVGDTYTVTITVTNEGSGPGTTDVVDDYESPDKVTVTNIDPTETSHDKNNGIITWADQEFDAGQSRDYMYDVTVDGPFNEGDPQGECDTGEFSVINTVTVTGDSDQAEVCVTADPAFDVDKSVSDNDVDFGDTVIYTITVTNVGDGPGSTDVVDDFDEDKVTVSNISDGGQIVEDPNDPGSGNEVILWTSDTLDPDEPQSFTYDGTFDQPFSDGDATGDCGLNQFLVQNTVTVDGDMDQEEVCVTADPAFEVTKTASETDVEFGDTVIYTVTVTNVGDGPGSTTVTDDFPEDKVTVSNISDGGQIVDDGGNLKIQWTSDTLDPDEPQSFTYDGTFDQPFSSDDPQGSCSPGEFEVVNTVTVDGDDDNEIVCVEADPDLSISKSTDAGDTVFEGDDITYTIEYTNAGDAPANDVVITDEVPENSTFESCSDSCNVAGDTVTWEIGTVEVGDPGSVTLTVTATPTAACQICNTATLSASNHTSVDSDTVCVNAEPTPDVSGANASGSAFGLHVGVDLLGVDETLVPVSSSQSGLGSDSAGDQVLGVDLPDDGSVLAVDLLTTSSDSTVSENPAQARNVSVAQTAGVSVLDGVVTADVITAVAEATATGTSSAFSSVGSTIENLQVDADGPGGDDPIAIEDVVPGTVIDLEPNVFGDGSYVAIYERISSTSQPPADQVSGGTYAADLTVNMIHVHVTGLLTLTPVDVIVSQAVAHADFPQTFVCEGLADQSVSGHAFIVSEQTNPALLLVLHGFVSIPASGSGGFEQQQLLFVTAPEDGSVATTATAWSESSGINGANTSTASSEAYAEEVCLLPDENGDCLVAATAVKSQSNSTADATGASSDDTGTELVGLNVAGTPIAATPDPNTEVINIPGVAIIVLNEQFCDGTADLANSCQAASGDSAGLTVRAIHVILLDPENLGAEVIVAEAHSDATFTPAVA